MRCAVLSDVHANLHALSAVVAEVQAAAVDAVVCAGDVVGYGPAPNECVELLAELGAQCVAGNHDLIAVGRLSEARSGVLARQTLAWTRSVLTPASAAFLSGLPLTLQVDDVLVAHGSPGDPEEYVRSEPRARELLDLLPSPTAHLVLGHTHHQWVVGAVEGELLRRVPGRVQLRHGQRYLLNPGSVGQSRDDDALARFLLLDTVACTADLRVVSYDVEASAAALRGAGLPVRGLHLGDRSARELLLGARRRLVRCTGRTPAAPRTGPRRGKRDETAR